jgi:Domain of unknown function (DUF397)
MERLDPRWRKSSYSGNGGADCLETGSIAGAIVVRDTKDRDGIVLTFTAAAWRVFAEELKQR